MNRCKLASGRASEDEHEREAPWFPGVAGISGGGRRASPEQVLTSEAGEQTPQLGMENSMDSGCSRPG